MAPLHPPPSSSSPSSLISLPFSIIKNLLLNPKYLPHLSGLILIGECFLCLGIVRWVEYTEIDWKAYMEQCEGFLNGERDYSKLEGGTGPLVYPAFFLYIYSLLYLLTSQGKNILLAQYVFIGVYLICLGIGMDFWRRGGKGRSKFPPYPLILLSLSKRLHSIHLLRLFNDCFCNLFFLLGVWLIVVGIGMIGEGEEVDREDKENEKGSEVVGTEGKEGGKERGRERKNKIKTKNRKDNNNNNNAIKLEEEISRSDKKGTDGTMMNEENEKKKKKKERWGNLLVGLGCSVYSLALGIKMNILLYFPALALILFQNMGLLKTLANIGRIGVVQFLLSAPFYFSPYPITTYLLTSFNFSRSFLHKWTVNWRFIPENIFLSKWFGWGLLMVFLSLLLVWGEGRWVVVGERDGGERKGERGRRWGRRIGQLVYRGGKIRNWGKSPLVGMELKKARDPDYILATLFTCNLLGIITSRSLHYQFYAWYALQVPYLLWRTDFPIVIRLSIWLAIEYAWNIFPSTNLSSLILLTAHLTLLVGIWRGTSPARWNSSLLDDVDSLHQHHQAKKEP